MITRNHHAHIDMYIIIICIMCHGVMLLYLDCLYTMYSNQFRVSSSWSSYISPFSLLWYLHSSTLIIIHVPYDMVLGACLCVACLPCHGNTPRTKYARMKPSASRSSRRLWAITTRSTINQTLMIHCNEWRFMINEWYTKSMMSINWCISRCTCQWITLCKWYMNLIIHQYQYQYHYHITMHIYDGYDTVYTLVRGSRYGLARPKSIILTILDCLFNPMMHIHTYPYIYNSTYDH